MKGEGNCPKCKGSGKYTAKCITCSGKGEVTDQGTQQTKTCPNCQGSGSHEYDCVNSEPT